MTTIFSKIVSREIPANIIHEDDITLSFLDIQPVNLGHALVIPKKASIDGTETDPETLGHIMKVAQKIALAQKKILGATGVNFIMNNGTDAGQDVFHTHLHIIPRYPNDNKFSSPGHTEYKEKEAEELTEKLARELS